MDNRDLEILEAIQRIIDPLKTDINEMKTDINEMKTDMNEMKERLNNVEHEIHRTNVMIENKIEPRIKALAEGYMPLVDKVRNVPEDIENLKGRVSHLEYVQKHLMEKVRKQ